MQYVPHFRYSILIFVFLLAACERKAAENSTKIKFSIPMASLKTDSQALNVSNLATTSFTGPAASSVNDISCFYVLVSGPEANLRSNTCEINTASGVQNDKFGIVFGGVLRGNTIEVNVPSGADRVVTLVGFRTSEAGYCPPVNNVDNSKLSNPYVLGKSGALRLEPGATQEVPIAMTLDQSHYIKECVGPDFGNSIGGGGGSETYQEPDQITSYSQISNNHFSANYCIPFNIELRKSGQMVKTATAKTLHIQKQSNGSLSVQTKFGTLGVSGAANAATTSASFFTPTSMSYDSAGNAYVADGDNNLIRKIDSSGQVTTFAGSTAGFVNAVGAGAKFNGPRGLVVDRTMNAIYVADSGNHTIRKIDIATGIVSTLAGGGGPAFAGSVDGTGVNARFNLPNSIVLDSIGNLLVSDTYNHKIRRVTLGGVVTTVAGSTSGFTNGNGTSARFFNPMGLSITSSDMLFIADKGNHTIRVMDSGGNVTTIAGTGASGSSDGTLVSTTFYNPTGVYVNPAGTIAYVADSNNHVIRKLDLIMSQSMTYAGISGNPGSIDGLAQSAFLNYPTGIAMSPTGEMMVVDSGSHAIRRIGSSSSTSDMHFYKSLSDCQSNSSEVSQFNFAVGEGRQTAYLKPSSTWGTPELFWLTDTTGVLTGSSPISYTVKQDPFPPAGSIVSTAASTLVFDKFYCHEIVIYGFYGSSYNTASKMGPGGTMITPSVTGADAARIFFSSDCSTKAQVASYTIPPGEFFTKVGIWTTSLEGEFSAVVAFSPSGAVISPVLTFNVQNFNP